MEIHSYKSNYFEKQVELLRTHVSHYVEHGLCVVDHGNKAESVMCSLATVFTLCREIAKAQKRPFVSVERYVNGNQYRVKIPDTVKTKPLMSQGLLLGQPYTRGRWTGYDISVDRGSSQVTVYYSGSKGIEALNAWLHMCETDNGMRYALGLPPKVRANANRA